MKKIALTQARWFVLRFLLDQRCFSGSGHQITDETLKKHVSREFGNDKKIVQKALQQLVSRGLVKEKQKHYGSHLWLNCERLEEIKQILSNQAQIIQTLE
jgi:predicted transcriptional regulator